MTLSAYEIEQTLKAKKTYLTKNNQVKLRQ